MTATSLKHLYLDANGLNVTSMPDLARALGNNYKALEAYLFLFINSLGNEGVHCILDSLPPCLRSLCARVHKRITDDTCSLLIGALRPLKNLKLH